MVATAQQAYRIAEAETVTEHKNEEAPTTVKLLDYPPRGEVCNGNSNNNPPNLVAAVGPFPEQHAARMLVTRSLSTDGTLDAVSIKLELELDDLTMPEMKTLGLNALKLETEIIETFFGADVSLSHPQDFATGYPLEDDDFGADAGAAVPARLLDIGKTQNNAYFVNVRVGAQTAKLFGSTRKLVRQLARAGLDLSPETISEKLALNFACRAITKPSTNGRYLQVVALFPAA